MNNTITIQFKIEADKYAQYKKICIEKGTIPAVDLKKHIHEVLKDYRENYVGYRIIAVNLCNNKQSAENLGYQGTQEERMKELASTCLNYNADLIFVEEFSPIKGAEFVTCLEKAKYKIFYPQGYDRHEDRRKNCITILATREDVLFDQCFSEQTKLTYRFIMGTVEKQGENAIDFLGVHVPSVDNGNINRQQEERKIDMLDFAVNFCEESQKSTLGSIQIGDYNTDLQGEFSCQEYLVKINELFTDTSIDMAPTWNKSRIDYGFASSKLLKEYEVETETIDDVVKERQTDHRLLFITIKPK